MYEKFWEFSRKMEEIKFKIQKKKIQKKIGESKQKHWAKIQLRKFFWHPKIFP